MLKLQSHHDFRQGISFSLFHGFRRLLLYSTSSSTLPCTQTFADHLVNSLSFSQQQALSITTKLVQSRQGKKKGSDLKSVGKSDSVIKFLKEKGFDQSHIRTVVSSYPKILVAKVDKTLKPKFEAFQEHGLSGSDLALFVSASPVVLLRRSDSAVLPALRALEEFLGDDDVVAFLKRTKGFKYGSFITVAKFLLPNVALLQNYGIPKELIRKHVIARPFTFAKPIKSFEDVLIRVEEKLGIPRSSKMFLYGVHLLSNIGQRNIESKFHLFKSFGWSQLDVEETIRRNPNSFLPSETRIKMSLNFLIEELGLEPKCVISNAAFLTCSLEGRLKPRYKTMIILKDKGLITKDYALSTVVNMTELNFLKKFVLPFKEVHRPYAKLTGRSVEKMLTEGSIDLPSKLKSNSNVVQ